MAQLTIYTDGACKGNPGPGGWGALIMSATKEVELYGGDILTTNNKMELTAVVEALKALPQTCTIDLYIDSQYVKNGIETWIHGWKRNGWMTKTKTPVKNVELWKELDKEVARHKVTWRWVKGHSGDPGNERADMLANKGVDEVRAK